MLLREGCRCRCLCRCRFSLFFVAIIAYIRCLAVVRDWIARPNDVLTMRCKVCDCIDDFRSMCEHYMIYGVSTTTNAKFTLLPLCEDYEL